MSRAEKMRMRNVDNHPCLEESDNSLKCLDVNNYQKDKCTEFFIKYKECKKFWHAIVIQRRRQGITPVMPTAEERKHILASYGHVPY
ncbi:coiled-coil-helix-coiled-coil-helix domain-containing protein 7 isoform X2 [Hyperolius riggenbachi]|uniref:coiled-coil-helix-coiled-coil-helix domain-containing protein 7 isoform X2 n=1 Tax=Hyperolius riggenbachi TaxID=752182 RepID=UPI0035A31A6A